MRDQSATNWNFKRRSALSIPRSWFHFATLSCFTLPLLTVIKINVGGELLLSDLLVLVLLPIILISGRFSTRQPFLKGILVLLVLWLFGAVVSDITTGNSIGNFARGWSKIGLLAIYTTTFFVLINGQAARYLAALMGVAVAQILTWILGESEYMQGGFFDSIPWKFGNGFAISIFFMIALITLRKSVRLQGMAVAAASAVHLALNARSLFLTVFLSGAATIVARPLPTERRRLRFSILVALTALTIVPVAERAYDTLMRGGVFGQEALDKHLTQTQGDMGILLGGRSESLISLKAIADSPIIGHGSWTESQYYYFEYLASLEAAGKTVNWAAATRVGRQMIIPSHSHFLGAWVEHGILGALFWIGMLIVIVRAIIAGLFGIKPARPVEMLALFWTLWNIVFSPFGAEQRCFFPVYLAIAVLLIKHEGLPTSSLEQNLSARKV